MAAPLKLSNLFMITVLVVLVISAAMVQSVEFDVGGDKGWHIPSEKNDQEFNDWASTNRFKINDTLRFEYKRDSVLVVTQEEYERCRSSHPMFFSNNGETEFTLDRSGLFYFISGVSGHCERGLKMIVKVLDIESPPQVGDDSSPPHKSATPVTLAFKSSLLLPIMTAIISVFFM